MAVRVLAAAALSAVLMFFWGFVYWGPVLNMTAKLVAPLPATAESDIVPVLRREQVTDGMYVYPGPLSTAGDKAAEEEWTKKINEGPVFHLAFRQRGMSPMDPKTFLAGFIHSFVIALLAGLLLAMVVHTLPSFASRVGLLMLVSLIAAIWTNVANVIWWLDTRDYCLGQMAYELGAGLLMALATAAIVRPPAATAAAFKAGGV
jgi:hypothetical protein